MYLVERQTDEELKVSYQRYLKDFDERHAENKKKERRLRAQLKKHGDPEQRYSKGEIKIEEYYELIQQQRNDSIKGKNRVIFPKMTLEEFMEHTRRDEDYQDRVTNNRLGEIFDEKFYEPLRSGAACNVHAS